MTNRDTYIDHVVHDHHDPYFMQEKQVDAAQFWWNHLTYAQRIFIVQNLDNSTILCVNAAHEAYKTSELWKQLEGWPA